METFLFLMLLRFFLRYAYELFFSMEETGDY